jgi:hypothetical protein
MILLYEYLKGSLEYCQTEIMMTVPIPKYPKVDQLQVK